MLLPLFVWLLLLWGALYFITASLVFRPIRMAVLERFPNFGVLLYCTSCAGFWVGIVLGKLGYWIDGYVGDPVWLSSLESAIGGMAAGRLWYVLAGDDVYTPEVALVTQRKLRKGTR